MSHLRILALFSMVEYKAFQSIKSVELYISVWDFLKNNILFI